MVRRVAWDANQSIHPATSLPLVTAAAALAAIIAVVAALCGARSRKASSSPSPSHSSSKRKAEKSSEAIITTTIATTSVLPPPPAVASQNAKDQWQESPTTPKPKGHSHSNSLFNISSKIMLTVSLSMRLPLGAATGKNRSWKEEQQKEEGKDEDSVWKKTIILGERCKVPSEEDGIIFEEKGKRVVAYHVRTPRSLPVSRSNSFREPDAFPF